MTLSDKIVGLLYIISIGVVLVSIEMLDNKQLEQDYLNKSYLAAERKMDLDKLTEIWEYNQDNSKELHDKLYEFFKRGRR